MENSASYLLIEQLLIDGQLQMLYPEFTKLVDFLNSEKMITADERQALLDLAQALKMGEEGYGDNADE